LKRSKSLGHVFKTIEEEILRYINKKEMKTMTYISVKCPLCGCENVSKNGSTKFGKQQSFVIIKIVKNLVLFWTILIMPLS